ncbi:MAG: hypothetical protein NT160_04495, partial [Actinobacteria bacterium]|nr:hypothetical protein [Actinomycetota bacterium]
DDVAPAGAARVSADPSVMATAALATIPRRKEFANPDDRLVRLLNMGTPHPFLPAALRALGLSCAMCTDEIKPPKEL